MDMKKHFENVKVAIESIKAYEAHKKSADYKAKGIDEDPFTNPENWPILLEGLKLIISMIRSIFGF